MASSKCNVVEGVETQEDDLTKATDLHDQEVDADIWNSSRWR